VPTHDVVLEQLTDILVRVLGCRPEAVTPPARLADLGTDSLTIVEVGEELGRRFDVYLSDDTIDRLVTVGDAVDAVVHHDGSVPPRLGPARTRTTLHAPPPPPPRDRSDDERRSAAWRLAFWLGVTGAGIGVALGLGGAALIGATGMDTVDLPPLVQSTTAATTATPKPTPTPTPTASSTAVPDPSLEVSSSQVSPGERFMLTGAFPELDEGEELQVEVREGDGGWDDFPITTQTREDGEFRTELYTSRTGERQFRLTHRASKTSTPVVRVQIG
jgi:acyl carrier protein